jgi:hypothetical protein
VSRRRAAVLVATAAAMLSTAQAAPGAALGVELPPAPGQEDTASLRAHVGTPIAEADVEVTSGGISASVAAPAPSTEIPLPAPPKTSAEPPASGASKGSPSRHKTDRARTSPRKQKTRTTVSERPGGPEHVSVRMPTMPESPGSLPSRSFLPEAAPSADESLAAAAAGSSGAPAALAGLVLVAIASLSWIALQRPRRLSPPLLSFALQRPG